MGEGIMGLLPLVFMMGVFYFLVIRPQQKQAKAHKEMIDGLKKGDKIITAGGLKVEVIKNDKESEFLKVKLDSSMVELSIEHIAKKVD